MIAERIRVRNFRNIEDADVSFKNGVNILNGMNAQGKTNLLEAVCFISLGRSFRTQKESDIIRFGEEFAEISFDFSDSIRSQNITVRVFRDKRRQVEHNRVRIVKLSDCYGLFRSVLFCPSHMSIVQDGPSERRNYLDVALSQLRPAYLRSLQRYNRILSQRNSLIKNALQDRNTFELTVDFWSEQLAHEAAIISKHRARYVSLVEREVEKCFSEMGTGEAPEVIYSGSLKQDPDEYADMEKTEKKYMELLSENHDREIYNGSTLFGIHKDDIEIKINGKAARIFGSQGQKRSLALSMKLAEGEISRSETGEYPVFLLDDVFGELDPERRKYLTEKLSGRQVILTSCDTDKYGDIRYCDGNICTDVCSENNIIYVRSGKYFTQNKII